MRAIKLTIIFATGVFALAFLYPHFRQTSAQSGPGGLAAPTGVAASNGDYISKVGVNWDAIRGATSYRIFRNTINDSGSATELGTTAANYFFDPGAPIGQPVFYWVRAENSSQQSELSSPSQGLRAQGTVVGPVPPLEPPPAPGANPVTAAKTYLGKVLFWEEQLSSTRTVSCGTCHINGTGGSDPRSVIGDLSSTLPGIDGTYGRTLCAKNVPNVPNQ